MMHRRAQRKDPLDGYQCAAWPQRAIAEAWAKGGQLPPEILWHAGNSGSKTTGGLALTLAMLMGREWLWDWGRAERIPLPLIRPPVSWVLGVESFRLASESTLPKLRELLGEWPHHETRAGGPDSVVKFVIRHRLSRDDTEARTDWSRLAVFSYEGPEPEAMRLDGWQCDEPAPRPFIDALRTRGKAGRPLYSFHTLTPTKRAAWEPIFEDFPTEHRKVEKGLMRLQSSVYDNRALHQPGCDTKCAGTERCPDIVRAEQKAEHSPYKVARLFGDPVDISGTCPFDIDALLKARDEAVDGERHAISGIYRDHVDTVYPHQNAKGQIEVWGPWPGKWDRVVFVADPSSGVKEPDTPDRLQPRNPSGLVGGSVADDRLFCRFNGYKPAHELGVMARGLCNRVHNWVMVVETNGGWGDAFLGGFHSMPALTQGELWHMHDPQTGEPAKDPGWRQSVTGLGRLLSALQSAIESGGMKIPSRAAIDNLLRTRLDANEKWDRGDGKGPHGEDVIVLGILAYVMARSTLPVRPRRSLVVDSSKLARFEPVSDAVQERW